MTPVGNGTHEFYKSRKKLATPLNRRSTGLVWCSNVPGELLRENTCWYSNWSNRRSWTSV